MVMHFLWWCEGRRGGGGGNYGLDEYGELGKGDQKEAFLSLVLFSLGLHVLYRIIANQCIQK